MELNKHFFAGSNSPGKFYNCFDNLLINCKKPYTLILKGGPGTGKSSLLKAVRKSLQDKKIAVESFHCSLDVTSLDAITVLKADFCMLDGTSPHAEDVNVLGIDSGILNLGAYLSLKVSENYDEITCLTSQKQLYLTRANEIFKRAKEEYLKSAFLVEKGKSFKSYQQISDVKKKKIRSFFNKTLSGGGGLIEEYNKKLSIIDCYFSQQQAKTFSQELSLKGYSVIVILNPLVPDIISGILIEDTMEFYRLIDDSYKKVESEYILQGASFLSLARKTHTEIEKYYIKNMSFERFDFLENKIVEFILSRLNNNE